MFQKSLASALVAALALMTSAIAQSPAPSSTDEKALLDRALAIHARVITLDTHNDIELENFTAERNYATRLPNQVSLPKMIEGGLDASFFVVYVGQGPLTPEGYDAAYKDALQKFDAIHRLTAEYAPDRIELALTPDDVRRIAGKGKKVALIGVENGYSIGEDLGRIKEFYDRGGRYLSLSHYGHSQLADSNTGERDGKWLHDGLSALGRQAVAELNRLGVMIDISHPSKPSNLQTMALSKAPVIASHSGARALCDHSRNLDDEQLLALKKNGGVAQMVALADYVRKPEPDTPERAAVLAAVRKEFGLPEDRTAMYAAFEALPKAQQAELRRRWAEIDEKFPPDRANVKEFVDHIDYVVKLIGIDHVGISSDFDGGGGVIGWNDATETFNVTLELVRRGYTEDEIAKIWSGNLLRVMADVQRIGEELRRAKPAG